MTLDDRLEHFQDENIKNVNKLIKSKTPDWAGTYEKEKKNLTQAILLDLLEIIGDNEVGFYNRPDVPITDRSLDWFAEWAEVVAKNELRKKLRERIRKYCE